jgi:mannonate dehydratase
MLAGVPRCIFSNFEGYKRALEIANSPNIGICLCCGSWLEGGKKLTGKDPEEMIRYFGGKKIFKIHFRNVSAPLPHFTETMIDDGYYDMNKIMRALVDVKFEGIVIPDHVPGLGANPNAEPGRGRGGGGGRGAGEFRPNPALAYLLGCMNSMLVAAQGHL